MNCHINFIIPYSFSFHLKQNDHKSHQNHWTKDLARTVAKTTFTDGPASFVFGVGKIQFDIVAVTFTSFCFHIRAISFNVVNCLSVPGNFPSSYSADGPLKMFYVIETAKHLHHWEITHHRCTYTCRGWVCFHRNSLDFPWYCHCSIRSKDYFLQQGSTNQNLKRRS